MKNIVTIGGGTGSYTVLCSLKNIKNISITALVSMADDGGSSGILRNKWNSMPPGDVRQCLAGLSGKNIINYRLSSGFLKGHTIGNLILAILEKITGSFSRGLKIFSFLIGVKGKIIPITLDRAILCGELKDGGNVEGESNINDKNVSNVCYKDKVSINPLAREAILQANHIIICPGSFYTSIVPNLIVEGFKETLILSKAKIIAISNIENQEKVNDLVIYLGRSVDIIVPPGNLIDGNSKRHNPEKLKETLQKLI